MAITATLNVTGSKSGGLAATHNLALATVTNAASTEQSTTLILANGDNTITVPANAIGFIFVPEAANPNVLKLKKSAGDAGVQLHKTSWAIISLDIAVTGAGSYTIIINSSAGGTAASTIEFF